MRRPSFAAAVLVALLALPAAAQEAEPAFSVESENELVTHYMWHGFDLADGGPLLQPSVTVSHRSGLWLSAWGSYSLTDRDRFLGEDGLRRDVDELDLELGYEREVGGVTLEAVVLWYGYPNADGFSLADDETTSFEPYVKATLDSLFLSPSVKVAYDTNLGAGWAVEGAVEHTVPLAGFGVTGEANLAWMRQAWRLTEAGEKEASLSDITVSLGVTRTVGPFEIGPTVAWTRLFDGATTPGDDTLWGKLTVTYSP